MGFLDEVARWLGVEYGKQFKVYDSKGNYVAAAVFKKDLQGTRFLATPKDDDIVNLDGENVLGGLVNGKYFVRTEKIAPCPFCGNEVSPRVMKFKANGQEYTMHTVFCENCMAHGPFTENDDYAIEAWNDYLETMNGATKHDHE